MTEEVDLAVTVDSELLDAFTAAAAALGQSPSEVMRARIRQFVEQERQATDDDRPRPEAEPGAADSIDGRRDHVAGGGGVVAG
jgi:predicted transcriptional regulator